MGWHINNRGTRLEFDNKRSPKYGRTRPTKRQITTTRRMQQECLHARSDQIGGGQCGRCGKFTNRPRST